MAKPQTDGHRSKSELPKKDSDMESSISSHDGDLEDDRNGFPESKRIKHESFDDFSPSHPVLAGNGLEQVNDMDIALNGNGNHVNTKGDDFLAPQGAYLPSYQAYSPERKQEVVNYARETTVREAARRYSVPRSTVQVWCKHGPPAIRKEKRGMGHGGGRRLTYSSETDSRLLAWVVETQKAGSVVTRDQLQAQALRLIREECPEFKASSGWVEKFLLRHNLSIPVRGPPNSDNPQATTVITPVQSPSVTSVSQSVIKTPQGSPLASSTLDTLCADDVRSDSLKSEEDDDTSSVDTASLQDVPIAKDGLGKLGRKDPDDDPDDDDDADGDGDGENELKLAENVNPERLKAFNMFVRLFVDENLDRLVPISKQPKDKIIAIIQSCQRQFPEFRDRARKRIRTYLKSCRRLKKLKEPLKRTADQISSGFSIPSAQMAEVNNILANACASEAEQAKRIRLDPELMHSNPPPSASSVQNQQALPPPPPPPPPSTASASSPVPPSASSAMSQPASRHSAVPPPSHTMANTLASGFPGQERTHPGMRKGFLYEAVTAAKKGNTQCQLNPTEIMAVRQLIAGYRESAAFLYRSADELEALLPPAEHKH